MGKRSTKVVTVIVGLDLGDRFSGACSLDSDSGEIVREWRVPTTR